jgi:hypothetical protein
VLPVSNAVRFAPVIPRSSKRIDAETFSVFDIGCDSYSSNSNGNEINSAPLNLDKSSLVIDACRDHINLSPMQALAFVEESSIFRPAMQRVICQCAPWTPP